MHNINLTWVCKFIFKFIYLHEICVIIMVINYGTVVIYEGTVPLLPWLCRYLVFKLLHLVVVSIWTLLYLRRNYFVYPFGCDSNVTLVNCHISLVGSFEIIVYVYFGYIWFIRSDSDWLKLKLSITHIFHIVFVLYPVHFIQCTVFLGPWTPNQWTVFRNLSNQGGVTTLLWLRVSDFLGLTQKVRGFWFRVSVRPSVCL